MDVSLYPRLMFEKRQDLQDFAPQDIYARETKVRAATRKMVKIDDANCGNEAAEVLQYGMHGTLGTKSRED